MWQLFINRYDISQFFYSIQSYICFKFDKFYFFFSLKIYSVKKILYNSTYNIKLFLKFNSVKKLELILVKNKYFID